LKSNIISSLIVTEAKVFVIIIVTVIFKASSDASDWW